MYIKACGRDEKLRNNELYNKELFSYINKKVKAEVIEYIYSIDVPDYWVIVI